MSEAPRKRGRPPAGGITRTKSLLVRLAPAEMDLLRETLRLIHGEGEGLAPQIRRIALAWAGGLKAEVAELERARRAEPLDPESGQ